MDHDGAGDCIKHSMGLGRRRGRDQGDHHDRRQTRRRGCRFHRRPAKGSGQSSSGAGETAKKIIDQQNLKFSPTVLAVKVGDTVEFPNHDKVWHNVYSKGGANDFDLGLYAPNNSRSKKFENAGISRILCNAHPDMEAFVVVKDHPFFSTSDSRGNYEIKNVPLGKLRVEIWYPNLGVRSEPVPLVRDGEVFDLNIDLKKR